MTSLDASLDTRIAGALFGLAALLIIGSAVMHPHVPHDAEGIATVDASDWIALHTASGFGFAAVGLGALLMLAASTPLARVGHAFLVFGGFANVIGTGIDGAYALLIGAGAGGAEAALAQLNAQVYTVGFGFLGIGGLLVLAPAAARARGMWRAVLVLGCAGFVSFALAGFVSVGMGADFPPFFFGGVPAFGALALVGLRTLLRSEQATDGREPLEAPASR